MYCVTQDTVTAHDHQLRAHCRCSCRLTAKYDVEVDDVKLRPRMVGVLILMMRCVLMRVYMMRAAMMFSLVALHRGVAYILGAMSVVLRML